MKKLLWALAVMMIPLAGVAQTWPSKPVRVVIPFPPGGPTDLLGRTVANSLGETFGQPFVVENKAGAAGNLGVGQAARSAPDGYTFVVVPAGNIAVNPSLYPDLPYRASDLAPVTMLATVENVLVVHPDVAAKTVPELIALARAKPGELTFASPGAGSQAHLAGELLQLDTGIKLIHVPYKGTAPAVQDLVGKQVTMMFAQLQSALPFIKDGRLRAIGIASPKRTPVLPDVPTVAEQGVPGFEAVSWYALMAPAGTPQEIVGKVAREATTILGKPANREKFAGLGMTSMGGEPEELARTIGAESTRWAEVIRKQGIKVQ
ncbi:MAG: Bug family tripartite tricarboxylate transporter substrate binding protein [Lautropia sp.]